MKSILTTFLLLIAVSVGAQDGPKGVPDMARKEIVRRGYVAQVISDEITDDGTARLCAAAGETPANDSDKFNLTVLYGKVRNDQLDKLKLDLLQAAGTEAGLGAWVNCKNRDKGTYDVYSTEDSHLHVRFEQVPSPGDPDKWKGYKDFPTIVFQTPYSGRFGKPGLVIDVKTGYDGKPDDLAAWLGIMLEKFAMSKAAAPTQEFVKLQGKRVGHAGPVKNPIARGHKSFQPGAHDDIGGTAPFEVTPKMLPVGDNVPFPFPPNMVPSEPKSLSVEQISEAAPGAPAEFVMQQLFAKVKTKAEVSAAWLAKKQQDSLDAKLAELDKKAKELEEAKKKLDNPVIVPHPPAPEPVVVIPSEDEPAHPVRDWILQMVVSSGVLLLALKLGLDLYRGYAATTPSKVDDLAVMFADKLVAYLEKKQPVTPPKA